MVTTAQQTGQLQRGRLLLVTVRVRGLTNHKLRPKGEGTAQHQIHNGDDENEEDDEEATFESHFTLWFSHLRVSDVVHGQQFLAAQSGFGAHQLDHHGHCGGLCGWSVTRPARLQGTL